MLDDNKSQWKAFSYLIAGTTLFCIGVANIPDPTSAPGAGSVNVPAAFKFAYGYIVLVLGLWLVSFLAMIVFVSPPTRSLARKCLIASMSLLSGLILAFGIALVCSYFWYVASHTGQVHWKPSPIFYFAAMAGGWLIGAAISGSWKGFKDQ